MAAPDYSSIYGGIDKNAAYQKQLAGQQNNAQRQTAQDALARRSAQLGGGPGGALINQEQQIDNQSAQNLNQANEGIDTQTNQAKQGIQMTQLGQQFQTGEREAGQQFQQGMQQGQFGHESAMQQAGFGQQEKLQGEQFGQQSKMQQSAQDFQANQSDLQRQQEVAGRQLQWGEFQASQAQAADEWGKQFTEQSGVDQFNEHIAQQMADKKDLLENLFGNFSSGNISNAMGNHDLNADASGFGTSMGGMWGGGPSSWNWNASDQFGG